MNNKTQYYRLPKLLFSEKYNLSPQAKLLFALLLDRYSLSLSHQSDYIDAEGKIYLVFPFDEAAKLIGCSRNSASCYMNELKDAQLITTERNGYYGQRIYITEICASDFRICDCVSTNSVHSYAQKPCANKTEKNKTEKSYYRSAQKKEIPKPSFDIDLAKRKAFMNPLLYFEKKNAKVHQAEAAKPCE